MHIHYRKRALRIRIGVIFVGTFILVFTLLNILFYEANVQECKHKDKRSYKNHPDAYAQGALSIVDVHVFSIIYTKPPRRKVGAVL
jgi:hypothetical protein